MEVMQIISQTLEKDVEPSEPPVSGEDRASVSVSAQISRD